MVTKTAMVCTEKTLLPLMTCKLGEFRCLLSAIVSKPQKTTARIVALAADRSPERSASNLETVLANHLECKVSAFLGKRRC